MPREAIVRVTIEVPITVYVKDDLTALNSFSKIIGTKLVEMSIPESAYEGNEVGIYITKEENSEFYPWNRVFSVKRYS